MIREDPVLIFMVPRSGSSMVASIFEAHGLWIGDHKHTTQGYCNFENLDIVQRLDSLTVRGEDGLAHTRRYVSESHIRDVFNEVVPQDTDWMFKANIRYWYLLSRAFRSPRIVFVKRNIESVVQSNFEKNRRRLDRKFRVMVESYVRGRYAFMDEIAGGLGIPWVDSDATIAGDFSSLRAALDKCGMVLDEARAEKCIDRSMWRH